MRNSNIRGLLYCVLVYALTFGVCYFAHLFLADGQPVLTIAILDILATVVVFTFSVYANNSSVYDPYWSVVPPVIFTYWAITVNEGTVISGRQILILLLVFIWGIRLTFNWIRRWKGMDDEDWRYQNFRNKFGKWYWPVSLMGIHLVPTLFVLLACIAVYPAIANPEPLAPVDSIASLIALVAIIIEASSDRQLRRYLKDPGGQPFLSTGLWQYSRHPNYFGEILFWVGLFIFSLGVRPFPWWIIPGPAGMILLFWFISLPMIDRRMLQKPGYEEYYRKTSGIIPWKQKK
ncbi:MAG: DUF1295 domain-containing protein [Bacteroidales bacterium]|nr:DUF1295 domain-containing protein [Bacteroidales bacterium]